MTKVIHDYPESWGAYHALVRYWSQQRNADELAKVLLLAVDEFMFDWDALKENPELAWFLQTPQYKIFAQRREELLTPRRARIDRSIKRTLDLDSIVKKK